MQPILLRMVQEGTHDVRLIAASSQDLEGLVEDGEALPEPATIETIMAERERLRALDESVAIARAAGRPQVSATVGLNQDLFNTNSGEGRNFSAGVDVSYPLFNGGRVRNSDLEDIGWFRPDGEVFIAGYEPTLDEDVARAGTEFEAGNAGCAEIEALEAVVITTVGREAHATHAPFTAASCLERRCHAYHHVG